MKKYGWYILTFLSVTFSAFAQELPYAWQYSIVPVGVLSGTFPAYQIQDTYVDPSGDTYVTGYFRGTSDFDPGPGTTNLTSFNPTIYDAFLAKYNASGNLIYAKKITGGGDKRSNTIALTSTGKVLIAGYFFNDVNFDPGATEFTLVANGGSDAFIARYDASGEFESASSFGGGGNDGVMKLALNAANDYYMSGYFSGITDFDIGAGVVDRTAITTQDRFLAKYDASLTLLWAHGFPALFVTNIVVDATGVTTTGNFSAATDMDPGAAVLTKTPIGSSDIWVSKFDTDGNLVWNNAIGGVGFENALDIAIDASSNIYLAGNFAQTVDFDPSAGTQTVTSNANSADAFVARYDALGNFVWVRSLGGNRAENAFSLAALQNNTLVVGGSFTSASFDADPGAGTFILTNAASTGTEDAYLLLLSNAGNFISAYSYGGPTTPETAGLVNGNGVNNFSVVGNFTQPVDFDPSADIFTLPNPVAFPQGYLSTYTLLATPPPAQPTNIIFSNVTSGSVDVSFTAAAGADGYLVLRRAGAASASVPKDGKTYLPGEFTADAVVAHASTGTSFTDAGLAADVPYYYSVFSYNTGTGSINYRTITPLSDFIATVSLTPTRTTDSLALIALYNSTNGTGWTNSTNWLGLGSIDTWHGITVENNRVKKITLGSNALAGILPPAIGNLTALDTLELWGNQLTGNIPPEIGKLISLNHIDLSPNQLTGTIPAEIGNLTALRVLWLNNNKLTGTIPTEITNLTFLQNLYLHGNQLTGSLPSTINTLTALTILDVSINKLTGSIPAQLGSLTNLTELNLSQNQFSGTIPTQLGDLTLLQQLRINSNELTGGIPVEFGALTSLVHLDMGFNDLTGPIPPALFSISSLQTFGAAGNRLTGAIPSTLTSAIGLINLYLDGNELSGALPSITSSTNPVLSVVTVNQNQLSELPDLSSLAGFVTFFDVSNNNLTFEDVELNYIISGFTYSPQKLIGAPDTLRLNAGQALSIPYSVGGSLNRYQWFRNNVALAQDTLTTLTRAAALGADAGTYRLSINSTLVPGLVLQTSNVLVEVVAEGLFTWADGGDLTADGANASMYSGVWGDFNNDGFEDVYTLGVSDSLSGRLYRNNGNGTFTRTNLIDFADGRQGTWGDYNNDGFLDLFVPDFGFATALTDNNSQIYKNNGNSTFTKINLPVDAASGTWVDFDNDGDLDLTIANTNFGEVFFRNDGGDVFTRVDTNVDDNSQWTNVWFHANDDNEMDILIPSPGSNQNTIRLLSNSGGFNYYDAFPSNPLGGLTRGVSVADIDTDGDYDIYVMLSGGTPENYFYINDGFGNFTEEVASTRLGETVIGGRGSVFGDLNNDGHVDLITYQTTGAPNGWVVYLNDGDGTFTREANQTFKISGGFEGISLADYNNDGFLDAVSSTFNAGVTNGLYRNTGNANNWLKIKLRGVTSNRGGVGARIAVKAGGFWRHQQVLTANGFANQNSLLTHVGMGAFSTADSIAVIWPSGRKQYVLNQSANQVVEIEEPINPASDTDMELIAAYPLKTQSDQDELSLSSFAIDGSDNHIILAEYSGSIDLDAGAGTNLITSTSEFEEDLLAKFTTDGQLVWVHTFPYVSLTNSISNREVTTDNTGNVIMGGRLRGTYDVDPGAGIASFTSTVPSQTDPFFTKFNAAGIFQWGKQLATTVSSNEAELEDLATDNAANIIVTGNLQNGDIDMDPSAATATLTNSDSEDDVFLGKYDADGNYVWSTKIGEVGDEESAASLVVDSQNNIYVSYNSQSVTSSKHMVKKYSPAGVLLWTLENINTFGFEFKSVTLDEANNRFFIYGNYFGAPAFNGTSGSGSLPPVSGDASGSYLASYNLDGGFINVIGYQSEDNSAVYSVSTLDDGNLLLTGGYEGAFDMDPSAGTFEQFYPSAAWVSKVTPAGGFIWGGSLSNSEGFVSQLNSQNELVGIMLLESATSDVEPGPGVVNLTALGQEFAILKYDIQGGVLTADSLALHDFYIATGGPNWTTRTNWLSGDISTWFGVTVTNDRITAINLPNNNLVGTIPAASLILDNLTTVNVATNNLTAVPDFSVLPDVTAVDISNNNLDFASLEYNMDVPGINLLNQKPIVIAADSILVETGNDYTLETTVGGTANSYQWKRNTVNVDLAIADSVVIENISRANMGSYVLEITNSLVPAVTLQTVPVSVLATANLSGALLMAPSTPASAGTVRLLRVTSSNGYDTIRTLAVNNDGTYAFNQIVLDDYQIVGFADTLVVGQQRALPTYYSSTILWEEADTLFVENSITGLDILSQLEPTAPLVDDGSIVGYLQEDDGLGDRTQKTSRVGGAGVAARRVQGGTRGKDVIYVLVAYVFTDEEGNFDISGLPPGTYRLNIQYPGYPMDETSFIDITIGNTVLDEDVSVEATIADGKISVRQLIITSLEGESYTADVYPNPSSSVVTVNFEKAVPARTVELLDNRGTQVSAQNASEQRTTVNVSSLRPGLYLLKVIEKGQTVKTIRIAVDE